MNDKDKFAALKKGLLELAVLKIVSHDRVYAADILASLNLTDFATGEGTLYPLLSRLRREKLVDYEWRESEAGPPRKYYHLTREGREQMNALEGYLNELSTVIREIGES